MFALCVLLVFSNVFREVRMTFLIKGHTHEDIDALFRMIKEILERHGALCFEQLLDAINQAFPHSRVDNINYVRPYSLIISTCAA